MSVRAGVVRFNLTPVLMLCLFDGSSEGMIGFLILVSCSLKAAALPLAQCRCCNPWLLVGICMYGHCGDDVVDALILMKLVTEVVYSSMPLDESWKIFWSVLAKTVLWRRICVI